LRKTLTESAIITLLSLALFIPFLSMQYDPNGLAEAFAIESGNLVHKNHILYGVVGYLAYSAQPFGYAGKAITVLQKINAICGALGAGFAYVAYKRVTDNRLAAIAGTALLASSFTYWLFSTDAAYITLAAMFATASMAVLISVNWRFSPILAGGLPTLFVPSMSGTNFPHSPLFR